MNLKTVKIKKALLFIFLSFFLSVSFNISHIRADEVTPIMGASLASKENMIKSYENNSAHEYPQKYINENIFLDKFIDLIIYESKAEGVRADVVFSYIMLETNWLGFSHGTSIDEFNLGNFKKEDGNYIVFNSLSEGIRANVQYLKGYASKDSLIQQCVNPSYDLIESKGAGSNVEDLTGDDWSKFNYPVELKSILDSIISENTQVQTDVKIEVHADTKTETKTDAKIKAKSSIVTSQSVSTDSDSTVSVNTLIIEGENTVGKPHTIVANANSKNGVLYRFYVRDESTKKWTMLRDYDENNSVTWTPIKAGNYLYEVQVKDKKSTKSLDTYKNKKIKINFAASARLSGISLEGDNLVDSPHKIIASVENGNDILYRFYVRDESTKKWTMLRDYGESNIITWVPKKEGNYLYEVQVKNKYNENSLDNYQNQLVSISNSLINNLIIEGNSVAGGIHTISAQGKSKNGVLYRFYVRDESTKQWVMLRDYSEISYIKWIPQKSGHYLYEVQIKDKNSKKSLETYRNASITIKSPAPATLTNLFIEGNKLVGGVHKITTGSISENEVLYRFYVRDESTKKWTLLRDFNENNSVNWIPQRAGTYLYEVQVKDKYSNSGIDSYRNEFVKINTPVNYISTYYNNTLERILDTQMSVNPQTDLYGEGWKSAKRDDVKYYLNPTNFLQFPIEGPTYLKVTENSLRVRSKPVDGNILTYVNKGEIFEILNISANNWYQITANKHTGWISGDYVDLGISDVKSLSVVQVTDNGLRVRSEPVTGAILTQVNSGEVYIIQDELNGWYKISTKTHTGWISGAYVKKVNKVPKTMYQFLILSGSSQISVSDLNTELSGKGILSGTGQAFIDAGRKYNINEVYLLSHALLETGNGTSKLAKGIVVDTVDGKKVESKLVYNVYGIGALDQDAERLGAEYAYKAGWFTPEDAIIGGAQFIASSYISVGQDTLYKMRWNPANPGTHQYATDIGWATKQTKNIEMVMEICERYGSTILKFDIPNYR